MPHLFVYFVTLVFKVVLWPKFGYSTTVTVNVWEKIGEKHLAPLVYLVGEGGVNRIFSTHPAGDVN